MRNNAQIQFAASRFLEIKTFQDLLAFVTPSAEEMWRTIEVKKYSEYHIPKPSGGMRLIEDPCDDLQNLQDQVAEYLMAVYHTIRSPSSYAFQWSNDGDVRNTRTNALRHLGNDYMIKADFENYFHQIDKDWVRKILSLKPFQFKNTELINFLVGLCTYRGRLPMGAPTSPVLANLALHDLDKKFETLAYHFKAIYTRYADDIVFSSKEPLGRHHLGEVLECIKPYGLKIKESKTQVLSPKDMKIVTGIVVHNDGLMLEEDYLSQLKSEIGDYFKAKELISIYQPTSIDKLKKHEQKIEGHIQYVGSIYGKGHAVYLDFIKQFERAKNTSKFKKVTWLDFNNYAFLNRRKNDPLY